jgi:hypothetical protein
MTPGNTLCSRDVLAAVIMIPVERTCYVYTVGSTRRWPQLINGSRFVRLRRFHNWQQENWSFSYRNLSLERRVGPFLKCSNVAMRGLYLLWQQKFCRMVRFQKQALSPLSDSIPVAGNIMCYDCVNIWFHKLVVWITIFCNLWALTNTSRWIMGAGDSSVISVATYLATQAQKPNFHPHISSQISCLGNKRNQFWLTYLFIASNWFWESR